MESPGSFLRKTSDAWEKQNDTKTIDELTIESLGRGRTSGFLGTNHSTANATFAPRQAAGSTLVSRQRGSAIFREARELIAETFLRRVLPRRGVESNAALKRGVSCAGGAPNPRACLTPLDIRSEKKDTSFRANPSPAFRLATGFTRRRGLPSNCLRLFASIENQNARRWSPNTLSAVRHGALDGQQGAEVVCPNCSSSRLCPISPSGSMSLYTSSCNSLHEKHRLSRRR